MGNLISAGIGIGSALLGVKKSKKQAAQTNAAIQASQQGFNYLKDSQLGTAYLPQGGAANTAQAALLGVGGDPAKQQEAFKNFLGSTGYNFRLNQGAEAITNNAAASGLLNSGATLKALNDYGQNMASGEFQNYFSQLGNLSDRGLSAGGIIGGAAQSAAAQSASLRANDPSIDTRYNGYGNALGAVLGAFRGKR